MKESTILVCCAHNDDQIIGAGGTIRKYANQGKNVYTYIFSFGESSHPHLRPEVIAKIREKESLKGARILGDKIQYLGLKEGHFIEQVNLRDIERLIKRHRPEKIFTHAPDDPHPDHQAVYKIMMSVLKHLNYAGDVYAFDIWNFFSTKTNRYPKLFVDVSDTFAVKVRSFRQHKSQINTMITLGWHMYIKALIHGWNNHCKYAELFHKLDPTKAPVDIYAKESTKENIHTPSKKQKIPPKKL